MTSSLEDAEDGRQEVKISNGIELSPPQASSRATEYSALIGPSRYFVAPWSARTMGPRGTHYPANQICSPLKPRVAPGVSSSA